MRLAESVPKTNPAELCGDGTDRGGFCFCPVEEAGRRMLGCTAGKLLIVSDEGASAAVAPLFAHPRAVSVVSDGADALPLFSMPDGLCGVFAVGNGDTIAAARFFAEVRGIPCGVVPSEASCAGAFGVREVTVAGERREVRLRPAEVFFDLTLLRPTLADGVGRLALARLGDFERRALAVFGGPRQESAFPRLPTEGSAEDIVRANAALCLAAGNGDFAGEGETLANSYTGERLPAWRAFCELSALYAAFFKCGVPRKYCVPDHAARARRAGVSHVSVCTPETYASRALALDAHRAELLRGIACILRDKPAFSRSVCAFSGLRPPVYRLSEALETLPERCPDGLSAVIRDFGLLEGS